MSKEYDGWEHFAKMWCHMYGLEYKSYSTKMNNDALEVRITGICNKPMDFIVITLTL